VIIVTKCPDNLPESERRSIIHEIDPLKNQQVFFSSIQYRQPYLITGEAGAVEINDQMEVLLVTGIANPAPLKEWLDEKSGAYYELAYSDHHIFSIDDLHNITRRFNSIPATNKIILTTQKDAVRLVKFRHELEGLPFYVLPIEPRFLFDEEPRFTDLIVKFITNFSVPPDQGLTAQA
jgi:tetraacyldisaccharide 4'-kinase